MRKSPVTDITAIAQGGEEEEEERGEKQTYRRRLRRREGGREGGRKGGREGGRADIPTEVDGGDPVSPCEEGGKLIRLPPALLCTGGVSYSGFHLGGKEGRREGRRVSFK